ATGPCPGSAFAAERHGGAPAETAPRARGLRPPRATQALRRAAVGGRDECGYLTARCVPSGCVLATRRRVRPDGLRALTKMLPFLTVRSTHEDQMTVRLFGDERSIGRVDLSVLQQ